MNPVPSRASRTQEYDLEEDDAYYTQRVPTSAVRYALPQQQVIQRGNKRIVIHDEPPPARKLHWSFILGVGMILMLALWAAGSYTLSWWQNYQLDTTYGMPRTYQTDQVVGHSDSTSHPTHFIAVNLSSKITIIEIPGGNNQHARIYSGPTIYSANGDSTPVTLEFDDVNGDSKVDMIVHVGDQKIVYLNDGTQFKPQQ
jgi:hypothetical protein